MMAKIVVLDPGHGGVDPGATANGLQEKDLTLEIANHTATELKSLGVDVRLTRNSDRTFSSNKGADLQARASFANSMNAAYFVSIHINAGGGMGFESYVYADGASAEAVRRRRVVHEEVSKVFKSYGSSDRGEKSANFAVLRHTTMPAILVECGFIDGTKDAGLLQNQVFLADISRALAKGIARSIGVTVPGSGGAGANPVPQPPAPFTPYYDDLTPGMAWAVEAVNSFYEKNIMRGDGNRKFRPNDPVTRLEMASALDRTIRYILSQLPPQDSGK